MTDRDDADAPGDDTGATKREGPGARTSDDGEDARAASDLARGTLIGRYVVIDMIGAGGMGVVYSAFDPELDRNVAIKLLQALRDGSESGGQAWLLREAQAMARLAHPNVVAVHDVGMLPGDRVFVAMELIDGMTLRAWLKQPRTWREVLPILRAAGAGLAAAHAAGLVHRDFKPDNVLVGNDGRVRVMDFGLARLHGTESAARTSDLQIESKSPLHDHLTAPGAVVGTPAYMAPEVYRGERADARADQFAFGIAMYEALYRARPFDRRQLVEQRARPPEPPAAAKVPAWVERIVLRALALDPAKRFASMDELLAALAKDPTAARRRVAIGAAAALACGGLVAGAFALRGRSSELCAGAPAQLSGVWDASTRAGLERAFHALGKPFADDAVRGTEKTLDAYATGWAAMRTDACKATRVRGDQSEDVLTLRMACLDNDLVELRTLVGLFVKADDQLVQGAVTAAQKLSPLADCADVPALLAPAPLPKDPAARRRVTELQAKLAEARALYKASRPKDTLALTQAIAADVTRLDHKPTEAEQHLLAGQSLWVLNGAAEGEPELMKAVYAAEAGKADALKLEALLQLTNLANESGHFDVAAERWQQASAALARLGNNWDMKVGVLDAQALLASRQNSYDKALAAANDARAVADQHPDTPTYAYALLVEASILTASGHPQEALDDFRKVLAYHEALGHRRIEVAVTLQSISAAELQIGRADDAIAHAKDALEINEAIYGPSNAEVARAMFGLGGAQSLKGDLNAALATYQHALDIAGATVGEQDATYASILAQLANTLAALGRNKEAVPYLDRALAIQTAKLGPGHVETLTVVLTKCDVLHAAGELAAAIDACNSALASAEKSLGPTSPLMFIFLGHTGEVLLDAKQSKKAAAVLDRALAIGANDPADLYYVALLDARAQWDGGDRRRAVDLARKARDGYATLGDAKRDQVHEADDWLKQHAR